MIDDQLFFGSHWTVAMEAGLAHWWGLISHQCGLALNPGPGIWRRLSLLLVLYSLREFFSRFCSFPRCLRKSSLILSFQFDWEAADEEPLHGLCHCKFNLLKFTFITYLFIASEKIYRYILKVSWSTSTCAKYIHVHEQNSNFQWLSCTVRRQMSG